jgi:hypothetical protein
LGYPRERLLSHIADEPKNSEAGSQKNSDVACAAQRFPQRQPLRGVCAAKLDIFD